MDPRKEEEIPRGLPLYSLLTINCAFRSLSKTNVHVQFYSRHFLTITSVYLCISIWKVQIISSHSPKIKSIYTNLHNDQTDETLCSPQCRASVGKLYCKLLQEQVDLIELNDQDAAIPSATLPACDSLKLVNFV